uniref:Uncharacterized protein n=1 Tax=Anguilla anguilla TaxID=7936 RepID=A0A0E9PAW0_ANGAN
MQIPLSGSSNPHDPNQPSVTVNLRGFKRPALFFTVLLKFPPFWNILYVLFLSSTLVF